MGVRGGGKGLIIPQQKVFVSYSHGTGWGSQAADFQTVIGASRKTVTTVRSSPTHVLTCSIRLTGWPVCRIYVL